MTVNQINLTDISDTDLDEHRIEEPGQGEEEVKLEVIQHPAFTDSVASYDEINPVGRDDLKNSISHLSAINELDAPRNVLDVIRLQEKDGNGRICMNKTMMRKETEFEEVITCTHSYDERCHTTYTTRYEPYQMEECEEIFRKVCMISFEEKTLTEMVEECTTPLVPDCDRDNIPEVCRIVYDTVCDTKQVGYEVEEQFPNCTTVNMEKNGEVWPVQ